MFIKFKDFLNEKSSGDIYNPTRNEFIKVDIKKHPELKDEIYDLIQTAYNEIGGHAKIKNPDDVVNSDWDVWEGMDIHNSKDFDLIVFGQKTKYGIKFSGVGHDGSKEA